MKKLLIAMFALLVLAIPSVCAEMEVSLNNAPLGINNGAYGIPLSVVAGDSLDLNVLYFAELNASDVVIEAELSYGHGKKIEASTDPVDVFEGVLYMRDMTLNLKDDVESTPSGESYTLDVRVKDGRGRTLESEEYLLNVQRKNDLLEIQKVMVPSNIEAGKPVFMTVVVKNLGSDDQDDVYIKVTSPELGLSEEERAGDIKAMDENNGDEDTATIDVPLRIPKNAVEGTYTLTVRAYNDNAAVEAKKTISVKGVQKAADSTDVVALVKALSLKQGKTGVYQLSLLNLGNAAQTYSVSVEGLDGWGAAQVNPLSVKLSPESSQLVDVALTLSDSALVGEHSFTVKVDSDGKTVGELTLTANVEKNTFQVDAMLISVVVLAIVLVALIVVLVKTRKSEDETEVEESYY